MIKSGGEKGGLGGGRCFHVKIPLVSIVAAVNRVFQMCIEKWLTDVQQLRTVSRALHWAVQWLEGYEACVIIIRDHVADQKRHLYMWIQYPDDFDFYFDSFVYFISQPALSHIIRALVG